MNKQVKVAIIVLAILSTTTMVVSAVAPTTPNLTELVQNIFDALTSHDNRLSVHDSDIKTAIGSLSSDVADVQSSIDSLPSPTDYSDDLSSIQGAVEGVQSSIDNLPSPTDYSTELANIQNAVDAISLYDYTSQITDIQERLTNIESQLAGIPVMESVEGGWEGTLDRGETRDVYNGFYPDIADIQATIYVFLPYDSAYAANVQMSIAYTDNNGDPRVGTFDAGYITSDMPSGVAYTFNFNSDRCRIQIRRGAAEELDATVYIYYTVTAKYIP